MERHVLVKTLKVLVISPSYPDERDVTRHNHIHHQLLSYHEAGLRPTVLELTPSQPGVREETFQGIDVIRFGILPGGIRRSLLFRWLYTRHLRGFLRKRLRDFDLVHIHSPSLQLYPVIDELTAKPVFFTCHGDEVFPSRKRRIEMKRRALLQCARMATGVSEYTVGLISHYLPDPARLRFVPNGIRADLFREVNLQSPEATRRELGLPPGRKIVLMACNLIERKGVQEVLRAFHKTLRSVPDAFLVIVGNGPEKEGMLAYISEHRFSGDVRMVDYIREDLTMARYYRACDLYVMFSKTVPNAWGAGVEGFGISYIDANAAGVPVIGGKSGGVPSAVIDGKTGFLVDPAEGDPVEALHQKMRLLLSDDTVRRTLGAFGQERVFTELTWSVNVRRIRALYDEVLASPETSSKPA